MKWPAGSFSGGTGGRCVVFAVVVVVSSAVGPGSSSPPHAVALRVRVAVRARAHRGVRRWCRARAGRVGIGRRYTPSAFALHHVISCTLDIQPFMRGAAIGDLTAAAPLDRTGVRCHGQGVGWRNPPIPWSELERRLSGRSPRPVGDEGLPEGANGGDSPAWSRKRPAYEPPSGLLAGQGSVPYAELHCHSNFSFLDGASHPEELAEEAARLGLEALAVTDHDGFYGVVRFAEAARAVGLPTVFGVELTLDGPAEPQNGVADPAGRHLVVLARQPAGYARLARAVSKAQMAGQKGAPRIGLADLADLAGGEWIVLTGCRKGTVPAALEQAGPAAAERALDELVAAFGRDHVVVELWDHGDPLDTARNDALSRLAVRRGVGLVATGNVHYATPQRRRLATAMAAVRARRSLDDADGWLPAGAGAHLRSGSEQARRFARFPGVVEAAAELGRECAFDLSLVAPNLPPYPCPDGLDEMAFLRRITEQGASRPDRYGPRPVRPRTEPPYGSLNRQERKECPDRGRACIWVTCPPGPEEVTQIGTAGGHNERAWAQIDHELDVIEALGFPGYFLIVWDIVQFCERADIFCQGRGSAANSAVCFALGVTKADAVRLGPPVRAVPVARARRPARHRPRHRERPPGGGHPVRLRALRTGERRPGRQRHHLPGALGGAGHGQGARRVDRPAGRLVQAARPWGGIARTVADGGHEIPMEVMELAAEIEHFPRHLGIHSGGMVLCDRPVVEVCPVEWGRMADRSVLQWDKDDCAAVGLVKFDLLGLGMLTALHHAVDLIREHRGVEVDLATIPQEPEVYDMLCAADSIGVFQVESRAQMATLPRLRPREFYDLVVEVALIRPGADPGRVGAPLHPAPQRQGAGDVPAPAAGAVAGQDARRPAVPGAADADGDRRRRVHGRGGRPAAPGHGVEALGGADGAAEGPAVRRHGRAGDHRRRGRADLREAGGVRQLRLPREPLGELRLPRLLVGLDQAARARGVLRRPPQRPADGLLLAALAGAGRPPPRRRHPHPRHQPHPVPAPRSSPARTARAASPSASASGRSAPSATTWPSASTPAVPTSTWRTSPAATPSPSPSSRRWRRQGASRPSGPAPECRTERVR